MSSPTELSQAALKIMARYLRMRPRLVWKDDYQKASGLEVYRDTDCAGSFAPARAPRVVACFLETTSLKRGRRLRPASLCPQAWLSFMEW